MALATPVRLPHRGRRRRLHRHAIAWPAALVALGAASGVLTIWGSWAGSRSDYYAAVAWSMSSNWSNFFFGAVDPAGTVTVDKIPGSYWIPALVVKAFGFSTFAVVIPNAAAAVAAVIIVAITARRLAGGTAGVVAGAVTATTPILVAVARSNQPEAFFVLSLALVAWAAVRALERSSPGWLVTAGVFIALAFQSYMLEAWAVWPALAAAYLCTRQSLGRRIRHLLLAGACSAVLSVAWVAIVALVPPGSRPYIGSTLHNSPWEMVFGYNGLGRFGTTTGDAAAYRSFTPPFSGAAGPFRLFDPEVAGQIAWLIPAALLAVAILIVMRVPARTWVLLAGWLVTFAVMFSTVAGMHQFYTAALAVPVGLLVGVAFGEAQRRRMLWPRIALSVVASVTAVGIAVGYGGYSVPVALVQAAACIVTVAALLIGPGRRGRRRGVLTAGVALVALVLTPAAWAQVTLSHPNGTNPVASGADASTSLPRLGPTSPQNHSDADAATLMYIRGRDTGSAYALAVFGAQRAAGLIIRSGGSSILPIGGFDGADPVPTLDAFTAMVQAGDVPYVLTSAQQGHFFAPMSTTSAQIRAWVVSECAPVVEPGIDDLYRCAAR